PRAIRYRELEIAVHIRKPDLPEVLPRHQRHADLAARPGDRAQHLVDNRGIPLRHNHALVAVDGERGIRERRGIGLQKNTTDLASRTCGHLVLLQAGKGGSGSRSSMRGIEGMELCDSTSSVTS